MGKSLLAYGNHIGSKKIYCWVVDNSPKTEGLKIGDAAKVRTKYGIKYIKVTKIEETDGTDYDVKRYKKLIGRVPLAAYEKKKRQQNIKKYKWLSKFALGAIRKDMANPKSLTVPVVYGRMYSDGIEYCWRVSRKLIQDGLQVGDTAIALINNKFKHVFVLKFSEMEKRNAEKYEILICRHKNLPYLSKHDLEELYKHREKNSP